jgi:hypothetical protein
LAGCSENILNALRTAFSASKSSEPVLIHGPTGTGKNVVAELVHALREPTEREFHHVNIASFKPELIGSELFGHVRGAFTGADQKKKGHLHKSGTIFLDEIGELPLDLQGKLLLVFGEQREFYRVGSNEAEKLKANLIFATNKNPRDQKVLREDFYKRINTYEIPLVAFHESERHLDLEMLVPALCKADGRKIDPDDASLWAAWFRKKQRKALYGVEQEKIEAKKARREGEQKEQIGDSEPLLDGRGFRSALLRYFTEHGTYSVVCRGLWPLVLTMPKKPRVGRLNPLQTQDFDRADRLGLSTENLATLFECAKSTVSDWRGKLNLSKRNKARQKMTNRANNRTPNPKIR